MTKTCKQCGEAKPKSAFSPKQAKCKTCRATKRREGTELQDAKNLHDRYWFPVCSTHCLTDSMATNSQRWNNVRWERAAYVLAALIRDISPEKGGWAAVCRMEKIPFDNKQIVRALRDLEEIGAITRLDKYDMVMCIQGQGKGIKVKRNWPREFLKEWSDEALDAFGVTEKELAAEAVAYYQINGLTNPNWWSNGQPTIYLRSEPVLKELSVPLDKVDSLFHGVDWQLVTATAQQDVMKVRLPMAIFKLGRHDSPYAFQDHISKRLELKKQAIRRMAVESAIFPEDADEIIRYYYEGGSCDVTEDAWVEFSEKHYKAFASLERAQLNTARCVYERRVVTVHRSNCRLHNKVSMLRSEIREHLHGPMGKMTPKDVNNAGIASAVYKVAHRAEKYPDVQDFIDHAKDGSFYQRAYDWLAANGVEFEDAYDDGGKAEVKYGTRPGRQDENQCSGVLPHLYHSGNVAYDFLESEGVHVKNTRRRTKMQEWAYANYPHVYEVIDAEKRRIAAGWLRQFTNSVEFRQKYRENQRIRLFLDAGLTPEEVAEDFNTTNERQIIGGEWKSRKRMWMNRVKRVQDEGALYAALPSAARVRADKITSEVSRSIHDAETAGQWQGVLKFKRLVPHATVVSIHDCIMTDDSPELLAECIVWGWANSLVDEDGNLYGVEVSVDDDD